MGSWLYIISAKDEVRGQALEKSIKIGRKSMPDDSVLCLPSAIVSRTHGEFLVGEDGVLYRDLDSSNGTYINGILYGKDTGRKEKRLEDGDVLKIDMEDAPHQDAYLLLYCSEPYVSSWMEAALPQDLYQIHVGRSSRLSNIFIEDKRVSRNHAVFFRGVEGWAIADNESTNGVRINNRRLEQAVYLKQLDCVRIADVFFIFLGTRLLANLNPQAYRVTIPHTNPRAGAEKELEIRILERSVRQGMKKRSLLKDINLTVRQGEMVLILGGSGAGKTTFMNAVMGYEKADGTIRYGGTDIYSQYEQMKHEIGFVPQDTLLRENDTVYKTLYNAAQMKMSAGTSQEKLQASVAKVLEMVNLTHVSEALVRSISGGEKKRVSAGTELVADPGLFFLDEPDSGLDAQSAIELMENLRKIADAKKIVMVISHSPDRVAPLFDKVIVLAKGTEDQCGHLAFFGSVTEAYDFFDTPNLEGVVGKINGRNGEGDSYIRKWRTTDAKNR